MNNDCSWNYLASDPDPELSKINEICLNLDEWPIIAAGEASRADESADVSFYCFLIVRKHSDGRAIVYGLGARTRNGKEEHFFEGQLLEKGSKVVEEIGYVAHKLGVRIGSYVESGLAESRCIASLDPVGVA